MTDSPPYDFKPPNDTLNPLNKLKRVVATWRYHLAQKLIEFSLDYRINNATAISLIFVLYNLLLRNAYIFEHEIANHHYVPRFLLKKFKISNSKRSIFEYTYNTTARRAKIDKVACVANLYSTKDKVTKGQSDFLEKYVLAYSLERFGSRVINRLLEKPEIDLTGMEESILALFVGFQYVRTPSFLYHIRLVLQYLHLKRGIPIEAMLERDFYKKAFFENYYEIKPSECIQFAAGNKLQMEAKDLILSLALRIGNDLATQIHKKQLNVLNSVSPAYFFLTDSPAEIFNLNRGRSVGPFLWELRESQLIYMPISPTACVYYSDKTAVPHIIGTILQKAIPDSIYEFAYSDRDDPRIVSAFKRN